MLALVIALQADELPTCPSGDCTTTTKNVLKPDPQQQIAELKQQLAEAQAEIRLYQQGLFQCQAAQIHEQAQKQAQKAKQ